MAEIAASIIGISTFGVKLTLELYNFGATTASAKQQTDHIAKHVTLYSNVLELLAERFKEDAPMISDIATDLVEELYDQSYEIFDRIRALLPRRDPGDDLSFIEKIKWNFKKTKVDLLIGELEGLKSTVQLLVTVIYTGKKIRSHRKRARKRGKESSREECEDLETQCLKAQNAIVEQANIMAALPTLQEQADRSDGPDPGALNIEESKKSTAITILSAQTGAIAEFQQSLTRFDDASQRQLFALKHSTQLLHDLVSQWTNVETESEQEDAKDDHCKTSVAGIDLDDLRSRAPSASTDELYPISDPTSHLPFQSRPATSSDGLPSCAATLSDGGIVLPRPPKLVPLPNIPDTSIDLVLSRDLKIESWKSHIKAFKVYMKEWTLFETEMLKVFNHQKQIKATMTVEDLLDGDTADLPVLIQSLGEDEGFEKYMKRLKDDEYYKSWWEQSCERHRGFLEEFKKSKKTMKDALEGFATEQHRPREYFGPTEAAAALGRFSTPYASHSGEKTRLFDQTEDDMAAVSDPSSTFQEINLDYGAPGLSFSCGDGKQIKEETGGFGGWKPPWDFGSSQPAATTDDAEGFSRLTARTDAKIDVKDAYGYSRTPTRPRSVSLSMNASGPEPTLQSTYIPSHPRDITGRQEPVLKASQPLRAGQFSLSPQAAGYKTADQQRSSKLYDSPSSSLKAKFEQVEREGARLQQPKPKTYDLPALQVERERLERARVLQPKSSMFETPLQKTGREHLERAHLLQPKSSIYETPLQKEKREQLERARVLQPKSGIFEIPWQKKARQPSNLARLLQPKHNTIGTPLQKDKLELKHAGLQPPATSLGGSRNAVTSQKNLKSIRNTLQKQI